jgi:hypothetical protein
LGRGDGLGHMDPQTYLCVKCQKLLFFLDKGLSTVYNYYFIKETS